MTERQVRNGLKSMHRWLGVAGALLLLVAAVSGFLLQHPEWLEGGDAPPAALAADPREEGRLLRGTRWGVEESRDGGGTWRELPMLAPPADVTRVHFDAADPARVFALGPRSLVTSADGGRVWAEVRFPPDVLPAGSGLRDVTAGPGGAWFVLTTAGVLASADRGTTWTVAVPPAAGGTDLVRLVHDLHTGHVLGTAGRRAAELGALALVVLTGSGLVLAARRGRRRTR